MTLRLTLLLSTLLGPAPVLAARQDGEDGRRRRVTPIVEVVREVGPTVVNLYTKVDYEASTWRRTYTASTGSLGAGVIIHPSGIVVTNSHVVTANLAERLRRVDVKVSYRENWTSPDADDSEVFEATLLGFDPGADLALLKIKADRVFRAARLGTSSDLMIGETVVAVGNPFGREGSVTHGIISATNREFMGQAGEAAFDDVIQTDVPLNGGNSGGPLFNILGELIGINQAIGADPRAGRAEGQGLAIPVDRVRNLIANEFNPYALAYGFLGMDLIEQDGSVLVSRVEPESPGQEAGLRPGDRILLTGEYSVASRLDFNLAVLSQEPGTPITLTVERASQKSTVILVPQAFEEVIARRFGIEIITQSGRVIVTRVAASSPAARLGLASGDILYSIGERRMATVQQVFEMARQAQAGNLYVRVFRDGSWLEGELPIR